MEDPDKVVPPSRNPVLIALRVDESGDRAPFTMLDNLALDPGYGSTIEAPVSRLFGCTFLDWLT